MLFVGHQKISGDEEEDNAKPAPKAHRLIEEENTHEGGKNDATTECAKRTKGERGVL